MCQGETNYTSLLGLTLDFTGTMVPMSANVRIYRDKIPMRAFTFLNRTLLLSQLEIEGIADLSFEVPRAENDCSELTFKALTICFG